MELLSDAKFFHLDTVDNITVWDSQNIMVRYQRFVKFTL